MHDQEQLYVTDWSAGVPYEILLRIFEYYGMNEIGNVRNFENLKSVCKYWSVVANEPKLWSNLKLSALFDQVFSKPQDDDKVIKKLTPKFDSKLQLLMNKIEIKEKFHHVKILNLSNLSCLTCDNLELIISNCNQKNLIDLNVSNCKKINFPAKSFEEIISQYLPNLKSLGLAHLKV